jgi:hypothetical protein
MIDTALRELERAGIDQRPETVLADGGYWNTAQIAALGHQGLRVIVPTKSATRTKARTLSPRQGPAGSRDSSAADWPPAEPNGNSSPPATTSSSSTAP